MADRPILFSGEMVRALIAGAKEQTRRTLKPQPDRVHDNEPYWMIGGYRAWQYRPVDVLRAGTTNTITCPYGQPGDRRV